MRSIESVANGFHNFHACSRGSVTVSALLPSGSSSFGVGGSRPLSSLPPEGLAFTETTVKKVIGDQSRSRRHTLLRFFLIFLCCFLSFLLGLLLRIREVVCEELDKNGMRLLQGSLTRLRSSSSKFGIVVDFNVNLANVRIEYIKSEHGRGKCVHGLLLLRI